MFGIGEGIILLAAVLGAAGMIARYAVKAVRWMVRFTQRVDALTKLADRELKPNGGSSLKDAVSQIQEDVSGLKQAFDEHVKETSGHV